MGRIKSYKNPIITSKEALDILGLKESKTYPKYPKSFIDRQYRKGDKAIRVGYCYNPIHRGYLNKQLLKEHKCLEKQCKCLKRFNVAKCDEKTK